MEKNNRLIELESVFIWKLAADLPYDSETETFYDYLQKEKVIYDQRRPLNKLLPVLGAILLLSISSLYSST